MPLSDRDDRRIRQGAAVADTTGALQPVQQALIHRRMAQDANTRSCGGAAAGSRALKRPLRRLGGIGWVVTLRAGAGCSPASCPDIGGEIIGTRRLRMVAVLPGRCRS
jgi:hypothetical protein